MTFEPDNNFESSVDIRVIGVGGGGNNAVNRMIASNIRGVSFVAVNTDRQALRRSEAPTQMVIGEKITRGFGAGANPDVGARSAEESLDEIRAMLHGADMAFITAGMGGGTGTGAAPIIARVAREMGILTVGIVTKPFAFEGKRRMDQAEQGIKELRQYVDSLVVIPNEKLKQVSETRITLGNAFEIADDVLRRGVQSISELINSTGYINLDFADVTTIMKNAGYAHMGVGGATGVDKAERAATAAITSPLLETSIHGARGILTHITASRNVALEDVELASAMITKEGHEDATSIWGFNFDDSLEDEIRITIIATNFSDAPAKAAPAITRRRETRRQRAQWHNRHWYVLHQSLVGRMYNNRYLVHKPQSQEHGSNHPFCAYQPFSNGPSHHQGSQSRTKSFDHNNLQRVLVGYLSGAIILNPPTNSSAQHQQRTEREGESFGCIK